VHCRDHAVQVHRAREQFEQAGIGLVLIGQATPRQAKRFAQKLGIEGTRILTDEDRATYRIAGFKRANVAQLLGPKSVVSGLRHGARSGVVQGRVIGDAAQLGGAMVIAPDGSVAFRQASEHAGDTVEPADLLDAGRGIAPLEQR
jgi:hypothetical protein